jgi:hypothetical protein
MFFLYSLVAQLSICSILFALTLRSSGSTCVFQKDIVRILQTVTFIISAELFSCDKVSCSVDIMSFVMIFFCVVNIEALEC